MLHRASLWSFLLTLVLLVAVASCKDDVNTYARIGDHDTSIFDRDVAGTSDATTDADAPLDTGRPDVPTPDDSGAPPPDATTDAPPLADADLCPDVGDSPCIRPDAPPDSTDPCPDGEERVLGECVVIVIDPPVECGEDEEEVHGVCVPILEVTPEPAEERIYEGSWTIRNRSDVDFITPYTRITGDLTVEGRGLPGVYLPNLRTVRLNLVIGTSDPALTYVRMPRLREVGGRMEVWGYHSVLDLPLLERVEGTIGIQSDETVRRIFFPSLLEALGGVSIGGDASGVRSISMPNLTSANWISIARQQELRLIEIEELANIEELIQIIGNPRLPQCQVDALISQVIARGSNPEISPETYLTNNPTATCE